MATTLPRVATRETTKVRVTTGPAAAAFVSAGLGCFVIGLMTTLAEALPALKTALTWSAAVGPLMGKTSVGVIVFFIAWAVMHYMWKDRDVDLKRAFMWSMILLALGVVGTFPVFFEAFTRT